MRYLRRDPLLAQHDGLIAHCQKRSILREQMDLGMGEPVVCGICVDVAKHPFGCHLPDDTQGIVHAVPPP